MIKNVIYILIIITMFGSIIGTAGDVGTGDVSVVVTEGSYVSIGGVTPTPTPYPVPLVMSSDTSAVTVGISQNAVFTVIDDPNYCPPDMACTLVYIDPSPVSGVYVRLEGQATGSGYTDNNGQLILNVNANGQGTIIATASKSGYMDDSITIDAMNPPTLDPVTSGPIVPDPVTPDPIVPDTPTPTLIVDTPIPTPITGPVPTVIYVTATSAPEHEIAPIRPTPTSSILINPSVSLTSTKTSIEATNPAILTLSMVNPIVNEVDLVVQPILKVGSGMNVIGSSFALSGANQYTGLFKVRPGESNHVNIQITSDEIGYKTVEAQIIYYPDGDKKDYHQLQYTTTLDVKEKTIVTPTPEPVQTPRSSPGFESIIVVGLFIIVYYIKLKLLCK